MNRSEGRLGRVLRIRLDAQAVSASAPGMFVSTIRAGRVCACSALGRGAVQDRKHSGGHSQAGHFKQARAAAYEVQRVSGKVEREELSEVDGQAGGK